MNGRVTDNALDIVDKAGTRATFPADVLARRRREGLAHISGQFVRYGLTSVHHEEGDLLALQQIRAHGDLKHRVSYEAGPGMIDSMIANGIETGFGDEWIRFGATSEHTVDGSFSERTMALSVPYPGRDLPIKAISPSRRTSSMRGWSACIGPAFSRTAMRTAMSRSRWS